MVFRQLAIALAIFSAVFSNANGGLPGVKEKYKIGMAKIDDAPNEYFSYHHIELDPDHFSCVVESHIIKTLPEDLVLKVVIYYQGQELPPIEFSVCPGIEDKLFVDDVVAKGKPKETFPRACPILPGNFTVEHWEFPHFKIPPGTPPGPVAADAWLTKESDGQNIFHVYTEGEIVLVDAPDMPFGK